MNSWVQKIKICNFHRCGDVHLPASGPQRGQGGEADRGARRRHRLVACSEDAAMDVYYREHFPVDLLCRVFGLHGRAESHLSRREFAITTKQNTWRRWNRICSPEDLRRLVTSCEVSKVHLGAVYDRAVSKRPEERGLLSGRELVFDMDLNDLTNVGSDPDDECECDAHWHLMAMAVEVVTSVMRTRFGMREWFAVYSGRRGVHVYFMDRRCWVLEKAVREAVVAYMQPGDGKGALFTLDAFFGREVREAVLPCWTKRCIRERSQKGLGLLDDEPSRRKFADLAGLKGEDGLGVAIMQSGRQFWLWARAHLRGNLKEKIVLAVVNWIWPRVDVQATANPEHLLKAPFSIHPSTGRVCVPLFGMEEVQTFLPSKCISAEGVARDDEERRIFTERVEAMMTFQRGIGGGDVRGQKRCLEW